jgi:protein-disulfide isomerase
MKIRALITIVAVVLFAGIAFSRPGQSAIPQQSSPASTAVSPTAASAMGKRVEAYLRKLYAWGPEFQVKVGPITDGPANMYSVPVEVSKKGRSDSAVLYVSKDGRYLVRGEIQDMQADPLANVRDQLHLEGYASKGPESAKVVIVEFGDFECPSCRALDTILREVLPKYPQVRLVFKDFPLESVHPWAMTAAIASHCVLQQSSEAYWKFHDSVYDDQDEITPENAYSKLTDLAIAAGGNADSLHACMAAPATRQIVEKSIKEGKDLGVHSTPTAFVNGRIMVGPDQNLLEQYIEYGLNPTVR